jgi:hypothetical protein
MTNAIDTNIEQSTDRQELKATHESVSYLAGHILLTDGSPGTSEDVAELVAILASDPARHSIGIQVWQVWIVGLSHRCR